ncbi:MAG: molybdopterin-guanine dinucleotide biosynthesis protein A [Saprospiraceae bacterium]|jgi:molybdopterin-guanine dinucleotide biosynthesis protein A
MKKHQKHTKLIRPNFGELGRNETAIVGAACGEIKSLAYDLLQHFGTQYKVAYADADHASFDNPQKTKEIEQGAFAAFTDHNVFERFDFANKVDRIELNRRFSEADFVLINGNHFAGQKQVVIIHPKKAASLEKKAAELTDVELILLAEGETEIPTWLRTQLEDSLTNIPVFQLSDRLSIIAFFEKYLKALVPSIHGLVLAGGKSVRMGQDKGAIDYHGKPQREYAFEMLDALCEKTFLSGRKEQVEEWKSQFPIVGDTFIGLGPFGAILSAFRENPNVAWLCVACDLPLLTEKAIKQLIAQRDPSKIATAFYNSDTKFPEPLITIWEPKSYSILLHFLSLGYSCPRKVLINSDVKVVRLMDESVLVNVNTEEERKVYFS